MLDAPVGVDPAPVLDVLARAGDNADAVGHFNSAIAARMDHRPALVAIRAPVLVITGSEDAFLSGAHEIADALPSATLVILPGADHFPYLEPGHDEPWSRAVLEFLNA
jgi:pimeloyl-ACP methyl ester carboxylesterase